MLIVAVVLLQKQPTPEFLAGVGHGNPAEPSQKRPLTTITKHTKHQTRIKRNALMTSMGCCKLLLLGLGILA